MLNDRTKTNYLLTKLDDDIREQIEDALYLISLFDKSPNNINQSHDRAGTLNQNLNDYSFLVFPAAKAYEGFLKRSFARLGYYLRASFTVVSLESVAVLTLICLQNCVTNSGFMMRLSQ